MNKQNERWKKQKLKTKKSKNNKKKSKQTKKKKNAFYYLAFEFTEIEFGCG